MLISFERRPLTSFEKWAEDRKPHCNDNNGPDHDNVGSMTDPDRNGSASAPSERPISHGMCRGSEFRSDSLTALSRHCGLVIRTLRKG
jgi:hypothetical protein